METYQEYSAFGERVTSEGGFSRLGYNSQTEDELTGLTYLRARYYNPATGRFTQEDVIYDDGFNLYAYCNSNPVIYCDPSGFARLKCEYKARDKTARGREYSKHAAERANERGFDSQIIDSIIDNNYKSRVKEIDKLTGQITWRYQDKRGNTVITNNWGDKIATVYSYPKSANGGNYIPKINRGVEIMQNDIRRFIEEFLSDIDIGMSRDINAFLKGEKDKTALFLLLRDHYIYAAQIPVKSEINGLSARA